MQISIARLRIWLVVGAALLVLMIGGFLGYARYRTHRFLAGLPGRLGIDIRRETNGYTYSQSVGGKTVMTLHASKAVEHTNGTITLHDVSMILYGRKQDRADRISGSEFEYEQAAGVVRAVGEVDIDLEAATAAETHGNRKGLSSQPPATLAVNLDDESSRVIHVKTSGLLFLKNLGIAATDQDLEFRFGGMTGHARGAEYNSDTGILILQSSVKANGLQRGTPVVLTASHAEFDRQSQRALLTEAKYVSVRQTARSDHAVVHLRGDGSPERIEAEGNVVLESPTAGTMTAPHGEILLSETGKAENAHFFGGVSYEDLGSLRTDTGRAQDARVVFDATGRPENVVLAGAVHVNERSHAVDSTNASSTVRDATAGRMIFILGYDHAGEDTELRRVEAASSAHLTLVSDLGTPAVTQSEMSGDLLRAAFSGTGKVMQLASIHGAGHTALRRVSAQGAVQTSSGDILDVSLWPAVPHSERPLSGRTSGEQINTAVQSGHVVLTSTPVPKAGDTSGAPVRATAELAVYDGAADDLTLTGDAEMVDNASTVSARAIVMKHASGDATAVGMVKANYVQPNSAEPVHLLADHAAFKHETNRAVFYGGAARPARLWQGASQVEAPVLDFDQQERRLTAHGDTVVGGPALVHAVLVGKGTAAVPDSAQANAHHAVTTRPSVVRVTSRSMVYLDSSRQIDFNDDVKIEDVDGVLRAQQATAYLLPEPAVRASASKAERLKDIGKSDASGLSFGGGVERIVATGAIEIDQPGRRAAGERLVYTARDGMFVLTGTPSAPPKLIDEVQGSVTGTSLRFHTGANNGDTDVVVTGVGVNNGTGRVHTVTRVNQK